MIHPTRNLLLIKADKVKDKTASGLYVTEDWKTLPPTGEVVAAGPEVKDIKVGDRVLFERYASVILKDDMRLCMETHVLGKLDA